MSWPYPQTQELMFECLKTRMEGSFWQLVSDVVKLAIDKGLYPATYNRYSVIVDYSECFLRGDRENVTELMRQLMWRQLVRGILVFGNNIDNGNWPNFRITATGEKVVNSLKPQPYDPDNFLTEFKTVNPSVDPVIYDYLEESVKAFNADCLKSSAVMLGAASEKAILLLFDLFYSKITNPTKKTQFDGELRGSWMISTKFNVLHNKLVLMADGNRFPRISDLKDIVKRDMTGFFDLARRLRNTAGHPDLSATMNEDTIFLNLRVFSEYMKGVYKLLDHFSANDADW